MDIAEALRSAVPKSWRRLHTNQPTGKRYAKAMGEWLLARSFHLINEGTRNRLLECLRHRNEIEKWRAGSDGCRAISASITRTPCCANGKPQPSFLIRTLRRKLQRLPNCKKRTSRLLEKLHRAEREIARGGGDLWTPEDTVEDIAKVMLDRLSANKAERVARAILKELTGSSASARSKRSAKQLGAEI